MPTSYFQDQIFHKMNSTFGASVGYWITSLDGTDLNCVFCDEKRLNAKAVTSRGRPLKVWTCSYLIRVVEEKLAGSSAIKKGAKKGCKTARKLN